MFFIVHINIIMNASDFKKIKVDSLFFNGEICSLNNIIHLTNEELISIGDNLNEREDLRNLTDLNLSKRELINLPDQIKLFKQLENLNLSQNLLSNFPYELLTLKFLDISYNNIVNIEKDICKMQNLKYLNLKANKIQNVPLSLNFLKNLIYLNISFNSIKYLTEYPISLINLNLSNCCVKNISELFCNLINLKVLNLNFNFLSELPRTFGKLQSLEILNLNDNYFEEMPEQICSLKQLKYLYMCHTKITIVSTKIYKLNKLITLALNGCQIKDLPDEICKLNSLKTLTFYCNKITKLPENIGNLLNLDLLDCSNNKIVELPKSIGNLNKLKHLDVSCNKIIKLDSSIGNMINLNFLDCSKNKIKNLPFTLKNLRNLKILKCCYNNLHKINLSIYNLEKIRCIFMSNNKIKQLPSSVNKLTNLNKLNFSNNDLKEFPNNCETLDKLYELQLSNNILENFSNICKMKNLNILYLDSNNIVDIPKNICNLQKLVYLNLSNNKISCLPIELLKCTKLKKLILKNNNISGVPTEFKEFLFNLDIIDLNGNPLNFFGNTNEFGLNELRKIYSKNIMICYTDVEKVYMGLKAKPIYFKFKNLKKCKPFSFPTHIFLEQELLDKINEFETLKSKIKQETNIIKKKRVAFDANNFIDEVKSFDTRILINYIRHIYNPNETYQKFVVPKDHLDFFKQLIGAIIYKLFSSNDLFFIEGHLNQLSEAICYCYVRQKAEMIYLYEILMSEEDQDMEKMQKDETILQNKKVLKSKKSLKRKLESTNEIINQQFKQKNDDFYLNAYIKRSIKRLIGNAKMRMFGFTFINYNNKQNVHFFNNWKVILKDHVGIDTYGEISPTDISMVNFKENAHIGLNQFYKNFTPEWLISELKNLINYDNRLICKIAEFLDKSDIENKELFVECENNDILYTTGVTDEFSKFILKDLEIIIFN